MFNLLVWYGILVLNESGSELYLEQLIFIEDVDNLNLYLFIYFKVYYILSYSNIK